MISTEQHYSQHLSLTITPSMKMSSFHCCTSISHDPCLLVHCLLTCKLGTCSFPFLHQLDRHSYTCTVKIELILHPLLSSSSIQAQMVSLMNQTTPLLKGIQNSSFQRCLQNELLPICTDIIIYHSSGHGEIETSLLVKSIGAAFILALSSTVTLLALPSSSSTSRGDSTIIIIENA